MLDDEQSHEEKDLHRGLKERHVQLIAIGGAIGVGLFLGSARAISKAGPGLMLSYAVGGLVIFFIMRALGELLLHRPVAGSFATFAEEYVGPWFGFATGWSYWFMWVVTGMAEITAVGVYFHYWFPDLPQWIPALGALAVLYGVNLIAVGLFGELEFWFALDQGRRHRRAAGDRPRGHHLRAGRARSDGELQQSLEPWRVLPDRNPRRRADVTDRDVRLSRRGAAGRDRGRGAESRHDAAQGDE